MAFLDETQGVKPELIQTHLHQKKLLSVSELCTKFDCKKQDLEGKLNRAAENLFEFSIKHDGSYSPDLDENIETIFLLYHATRNLEEDSQLNDLSHKLDSLDSFLKSQGQENNLKLRAELIKRIDMFMTYYAEPDAKITITSFPLRGTGFPEKYFTEGEWLRLSAKTEEDIVDYVKPEVVKELIDLIEKGIPIVSDYTHSTLSPALASIAKYHALISGYQTISKGETLLTGEDTFLLTREGTPLSGGKNGHRYIFANIGVQGSYGKHRWFDDFTVSFGMSKVKVFDNLRDEHIAESEHNQMLGDGYVIGSNFSLDKISHIYVQSAKLDEVRKWAATNAPQSIVVSFEAVKIYYSYLQTEFQSKRLNTNDLKRIAQLNQIKI